MRWRDKQRRFHSFPAHGHPPKMQAMDTQPTAPLELPCTGQTLRLALERRDVRELTELTRHLRVAGYRFDPLRLATELLASGCAGVDDAFGHRVPVHVRVPRRESFTPRDQATAFSMSS